MLHRFSAPLTEELKNYPPFLQAYSLGFYILCQVLFYLGSLTKPWPCHFKQFCGSFQDVQDLSLLGVSHFLLQFFYSSLSKPWSCELVDALWCQGTRPLGYKPEYNAV